MREGTGCGARGFAGCRAALLWKGERHKGAHKQGLGAAWEVVGTNWSFEKGEETGVPQEGRRGNVLRGRRWRAAKLNAGAPQYCRDHTGGIQAETSFTEGSRSCMSTRGWWTPMEATVLGPAGAFRMAIATFSTALWNLARGRTAKGGGTAREKCVRRRWREREGMKDFEPEPVQLLRMGVVSRSSSATCSMQSAELLYCWQPTVSDDCTTIHGMVKERGSSCAVVRNVCMLSSMHRSIKAEQSGVPVGSSSLELLQ
jgi:hypothetical protein